LSLPLCHWHNSETLSRTEKFHATQNVNAAKFKEKLNFGCSLTLAGYGYPFTQVRGPPLPLETAN
jgi:hypothetical protein